MIEILYPRRISRRGFFVPCRCAAGEAVIFLMLCFVSDGDIPRPGACYFALSGKVTKTLPKPRRFRTSGFVRWLVHRVSASHLHQNH